MSAKTPRELYSQNEELIRAENELARDFLTANAVMVGNLRAAMKEYVKTSRNVIGKIFPVDVNEWPDVRREGNGFILLQYTFTAGQVVTIVLSRRDGELKQVNVTVHPVANYRAFCDKLAKVLPSNMVFR